MMKTEIQVVICQYTEEIHSHNKEGRWLNIQLHQNQQKYSNSNNTKLKREKKIFFEKKKRRSSPDVPDGTQHSVKLNGFVNEDVL